MRLPPAGTIDALKKISAPPLKLHNFAPQFVSAQWLMGKQACHCEAFFAEAISLVLWTNLGDCFAPLRYARKDIIIFYWADTLIFYNLNFSIKKASLNFFWKAKIFSFLFLHKAVDGLILKNNLAFIKKMIIIHTVNDNHSWCELNNHNWR